MADLALTAAQGWAGSCHGLAPVSAFTRLCQTSDGETSASQRVSLS